MYAGRHNYVTLPVILRAGNERVDLVAGLDTGASDCLFERSYAEALGLKPEHGVFKVFSTANSRFEAFGHEVTVDTLGIEMSSMVFFFADSGIEKNVLGRNGWLQRVRLGVVDYEGLLYLAGYDDPSE